MKHGDHDISVRSSIPWCTQRECKPKLKIAQENKDVLESLSSAGTVKELLGCERSLAGTVAWSRDMEGHAKKCVGIALRLDKQEGRAIIQRLHTVCR